MLAESGTPSQEDFTTVETASTMLPLGTRAPDFFLFDGTGREIELRCITQPDGHQRTLLQRLGLQLPTRLGQPRWRRTLETLHGM